MKVIYKITLDGRATFNKVIIKNLLHATLIHVLPFDIKIDVEEVPT